MSTPNRDAAASRRYRINGTPIKNTIHNDKCFECGMGLCDPQEYHPYEACVVFKQTQDSREVWKALLADPRRSWA